MKVTFSSSFKKAYKKRIRFDPEKLRTHKLTGQLNELWSFSIEYDLRVIFYFINDNEVILEDIGNHDEVY